MRKIVILVSVEVCILCGSVVAGIMTDLLPLWVWVAGMVLFGAVIPLALYHRECIHWMARHVPAPGDTPMHIPPKPSSETPRPDTTRMQEAKERSAQADIDIRTTLYDLNFKLSRWLTPSSYHTDKDKEQDSDEPRKSQD